MIEYTVSKQLGRFYNKKNTMPDAVFQFIQASSAPVPTVLITETELRDPQRCFDLRDEIIGYVKAERVENLIVDLSRVEFVGSIAMLVFIAIRRELPEGRIVLVSMSNVIQEAFQVCRLISDDANNPGPFESASDAVEAASRIGDTA